MNVEEMNRMVVRLQVTRAFVKALPIGSSIKYTVKSFSLSGDKIFFNGKKVEDRENEMIVFNGHTQIVVPYSNIMHDAAEIAADVAERLAL